MHAYTCIYIYIYIYIQISLYISVYIYIYIYGLFGFELSGMRQHTSTWGPRFESRIADAGSENLTYGHPRNGTPLEKDFVDVCMYVCICIYK